MDERIERIQNDLSSLIVSHGSALASERYRPSADVDASDAKMQESARWVRELRDIRNRFENLVLGIGDAADAKKQ